MEYKSKKKQLYSGGGNVVDTIRPRHTSRVWSRGFLVQSSPTYSNLILPVHLYGQDSNRPSVAPKQSHNVLEIQVEW